MTMKRPQSNYLFAIESPDRQCVLAIRDNDGQLALPSLNGEEGDCISFWNNESYHLLRKMDRCLHFPDPYIARELWADEHNMNYVLALESSAPDCSRVVPQSEWVRPSDSWAPLHFNVGDLSEILSGWLSESPTDELSNTPWERRGWRWPLERWVLDVLKEHKIEVTQGMRQTAVSSNSTVLFVLTRRFEDCAIPRTWRLCSTVYVKAVAPPYAEVTKTVAVRSLLPRFVPSVLATNENVMVQLGAEDLEYEREEFLAMDALFAMQEESIGKLELLKKCGIPSRGICWLSDNFGAYLGNPLLAPFDTVRIRENAPIVQRMCAELAQMRFPETLVHGDFCRLNVFAGIEEGAQATFIDWERVHIGFPLFDMHNWEWAFEGGFRDKGAKEHYLCKWHKYETPENIERAANLSQFLFFCYGMCVAVDWLECAYPSKKEYYARVLKSHLKGVMYNIDNLASIGLETH